MCSRSYRGCSQAFLARERERRAGRAALVILPLGLAIVWQTLAVLGASPFVRAIDPSVWMSPDPSGFGAAAALLALVVGSAASGSHRLAPSRARTFDARRGT